MPESRYRSAPSGAPGDRSSDCGKPPTARRAGCRPVGQSAARKRPAPASPGRRFLNLPVPGGRCELRCRDRRGAGRQRSGQTAARAVNPAPAAGEYGGRSPASSRAGSPGIRCEIIKVITQTPATTKISPQQRCRIKPQKLMMALLGRACDGPTRQDGETARYLCMSAIL